MGRKTVAKEWGEPAWATSKTIVDDGKERYVTPSTAGAGA